MRFARILCGALLALLALPLTGGDQGRPVPAAQAAGAGRQAPDAPTVRGTLPDRSFRAWSSALGNALSFAPQVYDPPPSTVAFAPNPLVSSEHRATPEYEYLYTAARIDHAPPRLTSYQYPADNSYLISAAPAYRATAWPYQWRRRPLQQIVAKAALAATHRDEPAVARAPGQKIEDGLMASETLSRETRSPWRLSPTIGELDLGIEVRSPR